MSKFVESFQSDALALRVYQLMQELRDNNVDFYKIPFRRRDKIRKAKKLEAKRDVGLITEEEYQEGFCKIFESKKLKE